MQGLGNDFVVINGVDQTFNLSTQQLRQLADRHFGVGCDQVLVVQPTCNIRADFRYRIFNSNGYEVEQCGNGARCLAKFIYQQGLSKQRSYKLEATETIIICELQNDGLVSVDMGEPEFIPEEVPFIANQPADIYSLPYQKSKVEFSVLSMGNPHAVIAVARCDQAEVVSIGSYLEQHECFPEGVNVGFMQVKSRAEINLRVFERHVGETYACGSGACAAVVAGINRGLLDSHVKVNLPGGTLEVCWQSGGSVYLIGPAEFVFSGEIEL